MKKSEKAPTCIFVVVSNDGIELSTASFENAKEEAMDLCEQGKDVKILQVTKSWELYYPEEPSPEISEMSLGDL